MILMIYVSSSPVWSQTSPFSGDWKLNREKTNLQGSQLFLSKIKVELKSDSLLTTRVYENGNGQEYPFVENLALDGKDCKIIIYDMPRTSKASFSQVDGTINVESTTVFTGSNGEDSFKAKETWKIEDGGNILSIAFTAGSSAGSATGIQYFDKVK
jgi:hypothetical protein